MLDLSIIPIKLLTVKTGVLSINQGDTIQLYGIQHHIDNVDDDFENIPSDMSFSAFLLFLNSIFSLYCFLASAYSSLLS